VPVLWAVWGLYWFHPQTHPSHSRCSAPGASFCSGFPGPHRFVFLVAAIGVALLLDRRVRGLPRTQAFRILLAFALPVSLLAGIYLLINLLTTVISCQLAGLQSSIIRSLHVIALLKIQEAAFSGFILPISFGFLYTGDTIIFSSAWRFLSWQSSHP